jgi:hypothetical protein
MTHSARACRQPMSRPHNPHNNPYTQPNHVGIGLGWVKRQDASRTRVECAVSQSWGKPGKWKPPPFMCGICPPRHRLLARLGTASVRLGMASPSASAWHLRGLTSPLDTPAMASPSMEAWCMHDMTSSTSTFHRGGWKRRWWRGHTADMGQMAEGWRGAASVHITRRITRDLVRCDEAQGCDVHRPQRNHCPGRQPIWGGAPGLCRSTRTWSMGVLSVCPTPYGMHMGKIITLLMHYNCQSARVFHRACHVSQLCVHEPTPPT